MLCRLPSVSCLFLLVAPTARGAERDLGGPPREKCTRLHEIARIKGIGKGKKRKRVSLASTIKVRSHIMVYGSDGPKPRVRGLVRAREGDVELALSK